MENNNDILKQCRYYKGEETCPYPARNIESTFWSMERIWVKAVQFDEIRRDNLAIGFCYDFPDGIASIESIPYYLKATMYDQYYHFSGSKDGFEDFLITYLAKSS